MTTNICFGQKTIDKRFHIDISPTDSIQFRTIYKDKIKRDSIAEMYSNWHQRSRALEKYLLSIENPGVTRGKDDLIEINLLNGQKIKLTPDNNKEEVDFIYEHYFKHLKLLLFRVQWYEGNDYALVDMTSGQKTYMLGQPFFSPNKRLMISINCDIEAQYSGNGFQLFEIVNREIKKIWEYNPTIWGPVDIKWFDNTTLISKNQQFDTPDSKITTTYTRLRIKRNAP